ncbi:MAG: type II toxin-antitoxin system VapC family toxin [Bacillota bacterium]
MERFFVDTSGIFSLLCRTDDNHSRARSLLSLAGEEKWQPVLSNFILAETHALLLRRLGSRAARHWLLNNAWPVERITEKDEKRAREIIADYADKDFSYTDATSFAVMERLEIKKVFTFDRHFEQFGFIAF